MIKRIMTVDDSPMIHNILRRTLEAYDYEVVANAKNGKEAVELYDEYKPDLIFMDVTMPIMDGLEASKIIKSSNNGVFIILLTAMGDEELIEEAKSIGIDIILKKPFDEYKIISAISKLM